MQKIKDNIAAVLSLKEEFLAQVENEEQLIQLITLYIQELIDTDFEKLLSLLYRLDIDEKKVKNAIEESGPAKATEEIAKLIVKREKQKIQTRKIYKNDLSKENDWIF